MLSMLVERQLPETMCSSSGQGENASDVAEKQQDLG
jgi:hypothetical protein